MKVSPFKFLNSFANTQADKDAYFGREVEVSLLYDLLTRGDLVVLYGRSGTGKTSLVQCGLAKRIVKHIWYPLFIRRETDLNQSFKQVIISQLTKTKKTPKSIKDALWALFEEQLKPIHLIFDQFEELFVENVRQEKEATEFFTILRELLESETPCKFIISIREEYIAQLLLYEHHIPSLFDVRMRLAPIEDGNLQEIIIRSTDHFGIRLEGGKTTARQIIEAITLDSENARLPYLQIFLDKLWQLAHEQNSQPTCFTPQLIEEAENIENVLTGFLEKQLEAFTRETLYDINIALGFLKAMVSNQGTKLPVFQKELIRKLESPIYTQGTIRKCLDFFVEKRIIRPLANEQYELIHDRLAERIHIKEIDFFSIPNLDSFPALPKDILTREYPFTEELATLFFGREQEILVLYNKIVYQRQHRVTVVYGGEKIGKSALLRAGLIPRLRLECEVYYAGTWEDIRQLDWSLFEIKDSNSEEQQMPILILDHLGKLLEKDSVSATRDLFQHISALQSRNPQLRVVFCLRESALIRLIDYETLFPDLLNNRVLIQPIDDSRVLRMIQQIHEKLGEPIENPALIFDQLVGRKDAKNLDDLLYLCQTHVRSVNAPPSEAETSVSPLDVERVARDLENPLIGYLSEALAPFSSKLTEAIQNRNDSLKIRAAVIDTLPVAGPIRENVRKLLAMKGQKGASIETLQQGVKIYLVMFRLLNYLLMAHLWQTYQKGRKVEVPLEFQASLKLLFKQDKKGKDQFALLKTILDLYYYNRLPFFFPELQGLRKNIRNGESLETVCQFFHSLELDLQQKISIDPGKRSLKVEQALSILLETFSFLSPTELVSIKSISAEKNQGQIHFRHTLIKFGRTFLEDKHESVLLTTILPPNSVLLFAGKDLNTPFVNCSPFIVDIPVNSNNATYGRLLYLSDETSDAYMYSAERANMPHEIASKEKNSELWQECWNLKTQLLTEESPSVNEP
ncbi:MAG: ATP-binding protein [Bacteroidia bacterium]|nr:ATP-binding protein [Bacteroidia bacterium]